MIAASSSRQQRKMSECIWYDVLSVKKKKEIYNVG